MKNKHLLILTLILILTNLLHFKALGQPKGDPINYILFIEKNIKNLNRDLQKLQTAKKLSKKNSLRSSIQQKYFTTSIPVKIETFYTGKATYNPTNFLNDIPNSLKLIKYSEAISPSNCKLCQDKKGNYFVETELEVRYESTRRNETKRLYISFLFEETKGRTKAYIARITERSSSNRLSCYKKVKNIYSNENKEEDFDVNGPIAGGDDRGKTPKKPKLKKPIPKKLKSPSKPKTPTNSGTTPHAVGNDCSDEIDKLNDKIRTLSGATKRVGELDTELTTTKKGLDKHSRERDRLVRDSIRLESEVTYWKREYQKMKKEMEGYRAYTNWAINDSLQCDSFKATSFAQFKWANREYNRYLIRKDSLSPIQRNNIIKEIWKIYSIKEEKCVIKDGWTHLYTAKILANNDGNIIQELGSDFCEQIKEMNKIVLRELGLALEKGPYDVRSQASSFAVRLPYLLFPDRKCSGNSEIVQEIKNIFNEYEKGNYANSIGTYNKYQRLLSLDEFTEKYPEVVAQAKFAAGAILLWNMDNMSEYKGLLLEGTWLDENIKKNRVAAGKKLLEEALEFNRMSSWEDKYKFEQRIWVILKKYYNDKSD